MLLRVDDVICKVNIGGFNIVILPQIYQVAKFKPSSKLPAIRYEQ